MKYKKSLAFLLAASSVAAIVQAPASAETIIAENGHGVNPFSPAKSSVSIAPARATFSAEMPVIDNLETLKEYIYEQSLLVNGHFQVHYTGNTDELENMLFSTLENVLLTDDYLLGIVSEYGYAYEGDINNVIINFDIKYFTNATQEAFVKKEVTRIVSEIIHPGMTETEKVKAINDYIVKNTTYSENTRTSPHAAYTILAEGKGVCQAYALLAYAMLQEIGMEVHYVTGFAGEPHAWNLVKVDGEWYHLDTTWNDPTFGMAYPNIEDFISYDYFLISDKVITQDHDIDERGLPIATSERFSALRNNTSTIFIFDDIPYILTPEYVKGMFYYVEYENESYHLYEIDTNLGTPQVKLSTDIEAMDILATDEYIYFVDVNRQLNLSKLHIKTKEVTPLTNGKTITYLEKDDQYVYAYSNEEVVFTEAYTNPTPVPEEVKQIEGILQNFTFLNRDFEKLALRLNTLSQTIGQDANLYLTPASQDLLKEIDEQYQKMKSLSFKETKSWGNLQQISSKRKPWTITLSQEIKNTAENLKYIEVVDMFGNPIDIDIIVDKQTVKIVPTGDYVAGIPYTLVIKPELENTNGVKLAQGAHLQFMFE